MKFFEAALILRQYSKSFPLLRKCIDFLPILSKLDKYFYQFARIRNEENIVSGYLLTAQSPKINLVCDFLSTPPTYGDFSSFLLAVRLLSARSEVSFIMVVNELRSDWQELDIFEQTERIENFKELAFRTIASSGGKFAVVNSFSEATDLVVEGRTIFSDYVAKRKRIYWDLKLLNNLLYKTLHCNYDVLLDNIEFSKLRKDLPREYLLWHVRAESRWAIENDLTEQVILYVYQLLRKTLGRNFIIIVCGSEQGLDKVMKMVAKHQISISSAREYSDNFLGDLTLLYNSAFFLQVGGGGMAEYAWNSSRPFLITSYPWTREIFKKLNFVQRTKNQITSWQAPDQLFFLDSERGKLTIGTQLSSFWTLAKVPKSMR
ncbi:hypothetical protein EB083_04870 [bacterium]|nr:hypothetical protein [bacterium]